MSDIFKVGDTLECLFYVSRRDGRAHLKPGDRVKVLNAFTFDYHGQRCQDITVARSDHHMPVAVLVDTGRFRLVSPEAARDAAVLHANDAPQDFNEG